MTENRMDEPMEMIDSTEDGGWTEESERKIEDAAEMRRFLGFEEPDESENKGEKT